MADPKFIPGLAARVLRQIEEHPETWDQWALPSFVRDDQPTCTAGIACRLAGVPVTVPCGPITAANQMMAVRFFAGATDFNPFASRVDPRPLLRQLAARDEYMRTRSGGMGHGFCSALEEMHHG